MMLKVLYQDPDFIAVDKPSGLLVHRTELSTDRECAMTILRDQLGQWVYPVHRLDRATSGVLLFALNSKAAGDLSERFRAKEMRKTYLAVVRGYADTTGVIVQPLKRNPEKKNSPLLEAHTTYERVATTELPFAIGRYSTTRYSLVKVRIETGRLHQIRRHMCTISHPIVGDTVYGDGKHNKFFREKFALRRLLLCAAGIEFEHPYSGIKTLIRSASFEGFMHDLAVLNWTFEGSLKETSFPQILSSDFFC